MISLGQTNDASIIKANVLGVQDKTAVDVLTYNKTIVAEYDPCAKFWKLK